MELPELSQSLLESLVAMVATLNKVVAAVAGSDGDVLLRGSPKALWKRLEPFMDNLEGALGCKPHTASGKTPAKLQATPRPTWDSVTSAASDWQDLVTEVVKEWTQLVSKATEVLDACSDAASNMGGTAAAAAKAAKDLQEKDANRLTAVDSLVTKIWQLPLPTDKEKAATELQKYRTKVGEAREKTLVALKAMEEAVLFLSDLEGAIKRGQRAEKALGPLVGLVTACAAATVMFQELRRWVGDIETKLKETKEKSPDVPEDLVDQMVQIQQLWRAGRKLYIHHLQGIVSQLKGFLPRDLDVSQSEEVAKKCQEAQEAIRGLLKKVMSQ